MALRGIIIMTYGQARFTNVREYPVKPPQDID